jgi:hypothetical protein
MKYTNRFSAKRLGYSLGMTMMFIIANTLLCIFSGVLVDKYICLAAINICFFLLFMLLLADRRLKGHLPEFNYITYGKITAALFIDWIIVFLCAFFAPDFFAPLIIIPLVSGCVFDDGLSNVLSTYFVIIISLCCDYSLYIVLCYVTLVLFGSILSNFIKREENIYKLYSIILIFAVTTLISTIFFYFNFLELRMTDFIYGVFDGLISAVVTILIVPLFNRFVVESQTDSYEEFLSPDYSLCQDIRKFSYIEYTHALRVSHLCRKCASAINANSQLAACGGFYYRLGKLEGEPVIDNAIKLANDNCFPGDLIQILAEYGGIVFLPSSKESAIVHMVDSVVTKVELFDSDSMSSSWNQNMVIYQTINELSQKGIYDNSGLTMNQFLTIREILANEDILNDNLD